MLIPQQRHEIEQIAESWGVPPGTAAWAIVEGVLARARRKAPQLGEYGLPIAAALRVVREKIPSSEAKGA